MMMMMLVPSDRCSDGCFQSHRTNAAINVFAFTVPMLMDSQQYSSGGRHIFSLLELLIPGLDMNDVDKTTASFGAILVSFFSGLLLYDVSEQTTNGDEEEMTLRITSTAVSEQWMDAFLTALFKIVRLGQFWLRGGLP